MSAGSGLSAPSVLLKHTEKEGAAWERLALGSPVYTNEALVSLPGFASEVRLDSRPEIGTVFTMALPLEERS